MQRIPKYAAGRMLHPRHKLHDTWVFGMMPCPTRWWRSRSKAGCRSFNVHAHSLHHLRELRITLHRSQKRDGGEAAMGDDVERLLAAIVGMARQPMSANR
jgi:hypothetical protein